MPNTRDALLLITNLAHEDRAEDLYLADVLSDRWDVTVASPAVAVMLVSAGTIARCLIRNAWPAREFKSDFNMLEALARNRHILFYNPLGRQRGPVEDKTYLAELYAHGFPVIPTCLTAAEAAHAWEGGVVLCKPIDGCSSHGIIEALANAIPVDAGYIFQPKLSFVHEVSFFFIDDEFVYAMASAGSGPELRWNLTEVVPNAAEVAWAQKFVAWNKLPYGLQRIDAGRLPSGDLLLMEIEDSNPYLSLSDLDASRRQMVVKRLRESMYLHLSSAQPRELVMGRAFAEATRAATTEQAPIAVAA